MGPVRLRNAVLSAEIFPQSGAGLARLDWIGGGAPVPLLRPWTSAEAPERVNQLGCFVLVPWSNRMAGGFSCDGVHYPIAPNRAGDPLPIHGHGWEHPWTVIESSESEATLVLERRGIPFSFDARIRYALVGNALEVSLSVTNRGERRLPFGLGLHPYLPRTPDVTLQAKAETLWIPGPDQLPVRAEPVPAAWSFQEARTLPPDVIDHVFEGWDGHAEVHWPERGLRLALDSDVRYCIVFTPAGADFFCIEPVDHRIDAHNADGGPERHGLTMLAAGQTLTRRFRFSVSQ